ncbi:MAG: DsrE/DsrF/DrsH-like family protein [Geminicoccaceae bacterium]
MAERERLSVVLLSGDFERVHYALCVASTAAALERPVTLFVTLGGLRAFIAEDAQGRPGWMRLPVADPAPPEAADGGALDARYRARGVAGFEELLEACRALEVEFMVCEMGMRALGLEPGELRADLGLQPGGLATLLARGGQTVVL